MKIKLNPKDTAEILKAAKKGELDINKISGLKFLLSNMIAPDEFISDEELFYYLDCLEIGIGFQPNDEKTGIEKGMKVVEAIPELKRYTEIIKAGQIYRQHIKHIFWGMVAMIAVGGRFRDIEPDLSFLEDMDFYYNSLK